MTSISKWGRVKVARPRLIPVTVITPGAKALTVYVEPSMVDSVVEEYALLGWERV